MVHLMMVSTLLKTGPLFRRQTIAALFEQIGSGLSGLTDSEAATRLADSGPTGCTPKKKSA